MEAFLLLVFIAVLVTRWFAMRDRMHRMEEEIARLGARVAKLQQGANPVRTEPIRKPEAAARENVESPLRVRPEAPPTAAALAIPFAARPVISRPTLRNRMRGYFGEEGWEVLVGGSLLNKIGALVLVIGLALFLGYSFTNMPPAGRALTCVGTSWTLLGTGVLLERRQLYRVFARGLIGAGWAGLYVTAYAIYAVPAARLIESAYSGSVLLLTVAAGMIGHSLLYRKQAVTAVAYFAAFAALSVTPWSTFGFVGLLPLTASLLWIAIRLNWNAMSLFGVIALYGSCLWRGSTNTTLVASQLLLLVYWVLFESFDLHRVRRGKKGGGIEYVFPINAIAFLTLSYQAWLMKNPGRLWMGCAFAAVLFAASAVARPLLRRQEQFDDLIDLRGRVRAGSFELPSTLAAVLAGLAIVFRAAGVWLSAGLAIEAELLYIIGVALHSDVLRALGRTGFACSLLRLFGSDIQSGEVLPGSLQGIHASTPIALFHAFLFYLNRAIRKPNTVMSSIAAILIAGVLAHEMPERFVGTAWLVFGALLFEIGLRHAKEFRFQAYLLAAGGVALNIWLDVIKSWNHPWAPLALSLSLVYGLFFRARGNGALEGIERSWFEVAVSGAIAWLAMLCCWHVAPQNYRGLASVALSLVLLELGRAGVPHKLRYYSWIAAGVGAAIAAGEQWPDFLHHPAPAHVAITYAGATLLFYAFSERNRDWFVVRQLASGVSVAFALCTLKVLVPDVFVPTSWSAIAVLLFLSGLKRNLRWERWEGYAVILCSLLAAFSAGFRWPSIGVAIACYVAEFLSNDSADAEKHARTFWSIAGTVTLTLLLWQKFPRGLLTTAWGIEGIALLLVGFVLTERILRVQGLIMLLACILKLFLFDLRNLETGYRIVSFIVLGLILLLVSSLYSRFESMCRIRRDPPIV